MDNNWFFGICAVAAVISGLVIGGGLGYVMYLAEKSAYCTKLENSLWSENPWEGYSIEAMQKMHNRDCK